LRVALATCAPLPDGYEDDRLLARALEAAGATARFEVWDDERVDWESFDRVVVRSTWDYTDRREEFVAWAERVGPRLENPAPLLRWNSDKRYLRELVAAGIPTVPTAFVEPGDPIPPLEGEVVVKPVVSAGARDTGRFAPGAHPQARDLLERLAREGRTAMIQPYLERVEIEGETAIVLFRGEASHVLRKGAVLGPDEEAPIREDELRAAAIMWEEDLVGPGEADTEQRRVAALVVDWLRARFGRWPLYARVDLLPGPDGAPVLGELEAVEPNFYFATSPGAAERFAAAVVAGA